jgi:Rap1a immunity proteins
MKMTNAFLVLALMGSMAYPLEAGAVVQEDFVIQKAEDLVDVCAVTPDEPLYTAAIHFCHGYLVGAYHYYRKAVPGAGKEPFVCPPDPPPSRNEVVRLFVSWARAHPQYQAEDAVDALFRFASEQWPCGR